MQDKQIVELYWAREETAIIQTNVKYGSYCRSISMNILHSNEDTEECVNDTYLAAWNTMPPHHPAILSTFLGKLTRRISLDRWRMRSAEKRGGGEVILALEELEECVAARDDTEAAVIGKEMIGALHRFLNALPHTQRQVFLLRYWYLEPLQEISDRLGYPYQKTAAMLRRTRIKLRAHLQKEGYL